MPLQENSRRCLNAVRCGTILHEVFLEVAMPNFHRIIRNIRMGWSASRLKNGLSDFTVLDNFLESPSSQGAAPNSYEFMKAYLRYQINPKVTELASKIPSLVELLSTISETSEKRDQGSLMVDKRFQGEAMEVVLREGFHNTLFIINTGHSIPVGVRLMTVLGLPVVFSEDMGQLKSEKWISRLRAQCLSFSEEISRPDVPIITDSLVSLLDCHSTYPKSHLLPKYDSLTEKGITKVVLLDEIRLGSASIEYCQIEAYLKELIKSGIEVKRFGIDYRQSAPFTHSRYETATFKRAIRDIADHKTSFDLLERSVIRYKESPIEKFSDSFYAQSKDGKRYVMRDDKMYKKVDGFSKNMDPEEVSEFKEAIEKFESQRASKKRKRSAKYT